MWGTMMSYQLTLGAILERAGRLFGEVEIVSRQPDRSAHRYTYADFYRRARALAEGLQRQGLRRGERVATLLANHHAHLESFFGVPAAGGVLHTINTRLHPNDLSYIINHAQDKFLILDDALLPLLAQIRSRVDVDKVIVVASTGAEVPPPYQDYEGLLAAAAGDFTYPSLHENEAAIMCYTSGTTGSPKGIVYSHRALVLHAFALALPDSAAIAQHDVSLPVVPMYHANAWGLPIAATMIGCKQVLPGVHTEAEDLLEQFDQQGVTLTAGVPSVFLAVQHRLAREPQRKLTPGMRILISGAAPPAAMIRDFDRHGARVIQGWGLMETAALATISNVKSSLEHVSEEQKYELRATQGLPLPFLELRIMGDAGALPLGAASLGEVQVRGPWVASSYYNLPELRGKWTEDGWFRTGDVAKIDAQGYMKITDRAKDLIKSGDDWISSVDLENALMGHAAVSEAAVIAVQHPKWLERPLAAVVLKPGEHATPEQLRQFLTEKFAGWQLPDAIVFVPQLPHTPTGKLLKKELRKQFKNWKWEESGVESR